MPSKNQPITESDSLETRDTSASNEAPEKQNTETVIDTGVVSPNQSSIYGAVEKKESFISKVFGHINIYFVLLLIVLLILSGFAYSAYMQSRKNDKEATINSQKLTQDTLDKLANTDASVGDAKQTLSVESNAIFSGGVVIKGNIDVAGILKVGGPLSLPGLTVAGATNLDQTAVKSLTVNGDTSVKGKLAVQNGLSVTGSANVSGTLSASQLSVDNLQLNKDLLLSKHLITSGGGPSRTNGNALGGGGTASISGNDTSGVLTINTGNSAPAGCFMNITFSVAFSSTPRVVATATNSTAATLQYYVTPSTNGFSICTVSDPPDNTSNITFDYIVVG